MRNCLSRTSVGESLLMLNGNLVPIEGLLESADLGETIGENAAQAA